MASSILPRLLRLSACVCALALLPVFMPRSWIDASHQALGLGPFPQGPVSEYLARSLSAMYALFGGLLWLIASDLPRYRSLLRAVSFACLLAGPLLLWMDCSLALPIFWTAVEGPFLFFYGAFLLILQRQP